jgi:tRNA threonylcarbamoyladenosine modification (KEOPS) complex  Pcc1 subunit
MTYVCGTNAIYDRDEQVLHVIYESMKGDDYQKGNESCKAKILEDLICLYFEIESRDAALLRGI